VPGDRRLLASADGAEQNFAGSPDPSLLNEVEARDPVGALNGLRGMSV